MTKKDWAREALDYHAKPQPGKIGINITKPFTTQGELSLAYTPGVAAPVRSIAEKPDDVFRYTSKGNLVGVISNGTAVLGLGNTGPLASKPVMEGKAVLFKRFADIDVFDIEVDTQDTQEFIDTVTRIAPTFGGINLEDIAAPYCFEIERTLKQRLDIPVFHDDQHGTAIIVAAALLNALHLQNKEIADVSVVCLGAGAAGIASMELALALGAKRQNLCVCDSRGVIHTGRDDINEHKRRFALETDKRTVKQAMEGADVFVGVSGPDTVSREMIGVMGSRPIVFALSNPDPEISPEDARAVRDDLIMATGRSDYPNQVNNVLGFPFIFRGALDVRARSINRDMQVAAVHALCRLAREKVPESVLEFYNQQTMEFGPEYIIPTPMDPRLIDYVPPAVAKAAVESGTARSEYPQHYSSPDAG